MSSNPDDSGTGTPYRPINYDDTIPSPRERGSTPVADHVIMRIDRNIDTIKEDVSGIKHIVNIDDRMVLSDISIGVISSLIVAIIILFVSTNIGVNTFTIMGMKVPIFIIFVVSILLVAIGSYFITKKMILRKPNYPKKDDYAA